MPKSIINGVTQSSGPVQIWNISDFIFKLYIVVMCYEAI